jgi:hypothetical protein
MPDPDEVLQQLLKQESLTPEEAKQGLVSCFLMTNRRFVERRLGPRSPAEADFLSLPGTSAAPDGVDR